MNAPSRLHRSPDLPPWWSAYARYLPLLGLGIIGLLSCVYILTELSPAELSSRWLPNVYLPLQLTTFATLFFLASFLTLNTRRGFLLAFTGQVFIFLRLQQVELSRELVLSLVSMFVIIELLISLVLFLLSYANFSQKPRQKHRSRHPVST